MCGCCSEDVAAEVDEKLTEMEEEHKEFRKEITSEIITLTANAEDSIRSDFEDEILQNAKSKYFEDNRKMVMEIMEQEKKGQQEQQRIWIKNEIQMQMDDYKRQMVQWFSRYLPPTTIQTVCEISDQNCSRKVFVCAVLTRCMQRTTRNPR